MRSHGREARSLRRREGMSLVTSPERNAVELPAVRAFDVIVLVSRGSELAEATLDSLRQHLGRPEALRVVEAEEGPGDAQGTWKVVLEHLGQHPERDLLVVAPGVLAVPLLDLRLRWSAYAADGIAAVSPLCDVDPVTSLARHGLSGLTAAEIDDRIAGGGSGAVVDAPYFLPECFFVRGELIRRALAGERPRDLQGLVHRLRAEGLLCGLAPHVFVGSCGLAPRSAPWLEEPSVSVFIAETPLHQVARRIGATPAREVNAPGIRQRSRPRLLHVSHSLGGGLERWVEVFNSASPHIDNFVLKSIGEKGRFGSQLWLYEGSRPWTPLKTWKLAPPIEGSVVSHLGYRQALQEIVTELGIDGVVVSSLIGHSLDVLRSPVPTVVTLHDYYPFCPALHIFFDGVCTNCDERRLTECLRGNPLNNLFESRDTREWLVLREAFLEALSAESIKVVAPSPSVIRHLQHLAPRTAWSRVAVIPHGSDARDLWTKAEARTDPSGPLRVVVLGRVTPVKGEDLLREILERARHVARFWLVGCGERGRALAGRHVEIVERYDRDQLPEILARISPDVGLFLSVVPETVSFTLDECFGARIPPVALRVGSFGDRIEDGVNGFLCDPDAASVVTKLERLAADRSLVAGTREELHRRAVRAASDMVEDYARVLGLEEYSSRAYFAEAWKQSPAEGGYRLPAGSPLGFAEFLHQVETGTLHHIRQTRRLKGWKRTLALGAAGAGFRTVRVLMRWMVH